jgi:hypothetical protein
MKKVHTLFRVVQSQLGGGYMHPMKAFDEMKVAEEAQHAGAQSMGAILEGSIIVSTPQGPRKAMSVRQLLHELGIASVSHRILEQDVHGALILAPTGVSLQ